MSGGTLRSSPPTSSRQLGFEQRVLFEKGENHTNRVLRAWRRVPTRTVILTMQTTPSIPEAD